MYFFFIVHLWSIVSYSFHVSVLGWKWRWWSLKLVPKNSSDVLYYKLILIICSLLNYCASWVVNSKHFNFCCRMLRSAKTLMYLDVFNLMSESSIASLQENLQTIEINKFLFSSVARPTVGIRRTSIWGLRVRD